MAQAPPSGLRTSFQKKTIPPPVTIPAIAPALFSLFQKREKIISGPKVAPKPAQAKETIRKMMLFSSKAIIMAIAAMTSKVIQVTNKTARSLASFLKIP